MQTLTPKLAAQFGANGKTGVIVSSVQPDSPAFEAGIRRGAIIKRIGQKDVSLAEEFGKEIKSASLKDGILMLVRHRSGNTGYVVVRGE